jgi:Mce-associated membrane protein
MTTPEPPTPEQPVAPVAPPPSLHDRLAEFEPEDDDLFGDEYDDKPAPAVAPEGDVTAYDDSAFAAVGDEVAPGEEPEADPVDEPLEPLEPAEPEPVETADTVVLDPSEHHTAVLDPFAAAPAPLAAVPVEAPVEEPPADEPPVAAEPAAQPAAEPAADPVAATAPVAAAAGRRRLTLPVVALLLVTALMAAAATYLWLQVREHDQTESARRSGLEASRDAARLLFSYDYRTLDKDFATGRALTTGEFRNQYAKTTTRVVADVARQYKAVVKADVVGAGVVRATPNEVVTVVYVNQVTTSTRVTGEKVDLSRVRMTLRRSGGKWLVTSVNAL